MLFFHCIQAGEKKIILEDTDFHSLIRVRRKKVNDEVICVNIQKNISNAVYSTYKIFEITKKNAVLHLISQKEEVAFSGKIHLFWGVCDVKTITATLPMLNQMGVSKITFVQCERSQGNIKLNDKFFEKCETILRASCEQSGRNRLMNLESVSFDDYINRIKSCSNLQNNYICDFNNSLFSDLEIIDFKNSTHDKKVSFLIGPEGGFSEQEREKCKKLSKENRVKIRQFNTSSVLKSETACMLVSSFFCV